jgi:hypothetical protein
MGKFKRFLCVKSGGIRYAKDSIERFADKRSGKFRFH